MSKRIDAAALRRQVVSFRWLREPLPAELLQVLVAGEKPHPQLAELWTDVHDDLAMTLATRPRLARTPSDCTRIVLLRHACLDVLEATARTPVQWWNAHPVPAGRSRLSMFVEWGGGAVGPSALAGKLAAEGARWNRDIFTNYLLPGEVGRRFVQSWADWAGREELAALVKADEDRPEGYGFAISWRELPLDGRPLEDLAADFEAADGRGWTWPTPTRKDVARWASNCDAAIREFAIRVLVPMVRVTGPRRLRRA